MLYRWLPSWHPTKDYPQLAVNHLKTLSSTEAQLVHFNMLPLPNLISHIMSIWVCSTCKRFLYHWVVVKCIICYLASTLHHGLHLRCNMSSQLNITRFNDADWASHIHDHYSTFDYYLFLDPNLVSWHSRKQHIISKSPIKAKYRNMATLVAKISWLQTLLCELNIISSNTPII